MGESRRDDPAAEDDAACKHQKFWAALWLNTPADNHGERYDEQGNGKCERGVTGRPLKQTDQRFLEYAPGVSRSHAEIDDEHGYQEVPAIFCRCHLPSAFLRFCWRFMHSCR